MKIPVIIFVLLLSISFVSAQGVPGDANGDGCVTLAEVSGYVGQWLNGQVTLTQVSQAVSAWLQGCTPAPSGGSLYSAAYPLTWSSTPVNTGFIGAESNPTGNPLGGYYGYDRIVSPADADYIITTRQEFLDLFLFDDYHNQVIQPGDIVYIPGNVELNLTGVWNIPIPGNVTIASDRGQGFSKGALIYNHEQLYGPEAHGNGFMYTYGPNVRITGLRFEGQDKSTQTVRGNQLFFAGRPDLAADNYYFMGVSTGIGLRYAFAEIDNNEFSGWTTAIALGEASPEFGGSVPMNGWGGSENTWIHHNYIHHNPHKGLGYGVSVGASNRPAEYTVSALIEANLFDFNRHSVASTAERYSDYQAAYNVVLPETIGVPFDRHGGGGLAGTHTIIHHNTCFAIKSDASCIGIANPGYTPGISMAYNNWAQIRREENAIGDTSYPGQILIFGNHYSPFSPTGVSLPKPVISLAKDNFNIGENIAFSASQSTGGTNSLSYVCWDYGDNSEEECGLVSTTRNRAYSQPGRYMVTLKAVDTKGVFSTITKHVIVKPSNPNAVVLSFWVRDSFNEHNTDDASGYFTKRILVDNDVVWSRDVNADGWEWEHVVIDITNYVEDTSVINFQVRSSQTYQRQNYPAYHPFEFFELYIDDIYVFNADYPEENFGTWEVDSLIDYDFLDTLQGRVDGVGTTHFYNTGGESWWGGNVKYDDKLGGGYSYMITSGYRENSIAGTTRGIKQTIKKIPIALVDIQSDSTGVVRDYSGHLRNVNFAGTVDGSNNLVNDFSGYSKRLGGNNYASVSGVDLSQNWVLDMNVFLPYTNSQQTLMYASNGANYVHVYYSPTNNIVLKTNSVETTCSVPQLSHNNFNKIVVGRSCVGATCTLSCASNGVVNSFTNNNAVITLSGTSTVNFGGYSGGTTNLFGAINNAKLLQGSLQNSVFVNESKSWLQGAWYFRDGTNGVIQDASLYDNDVDVSGITFGTDAQRRFGQFSNNGPSVNIPRDSSFRVGDKFSLEFVARFDALDGFNLVSGQPYYVRVWEYIPPAWPSDLSAFLYIKIPQSLAIGDSFDSGFNAVKTTQKLQENKWYHLVFTKEGEYLNVYVNGVMDRKVYIPGVTYDNSAISDLIMGGFDGDVSRMAIYDRTLDPSEIEAKYMTSALGCSDSDNDGFGVFPRSGVINGCRFDGFDCNDANAGVGAGVC